MSKQFYGYGVVDKDGKPWMDEGCICEYKDMLESEVVGPLNAEYEILGIDDEDEIKHDGFRPPAPYRVVALYWDDNNVAQAEEGYPQ